MNISGKVRKFFSGDGRSASLKRNVAGSVILRGISIIISFYQVPLVIDLINPTQYGIWLTLSSLLAWLTFFDIGLTHGFRNKFAEAMAMGDIKLAKIYTSTTYAVLSGMGLLLILLSIPAAHFINWGEILKINSDYNSELAYVFLIIVDCFAINLSAQVLPTILIADQHPAKASFFQVLGQAIALCCLIILIKTAETVSLVSIACIFSFVPLLTIICASAFLYTKRYRSVAPSIKCIDFRYLRQLIGLGGKFFVIVVSMLFIFQLMNIIISRVEGPEAVTQYNLSYKLFYAVFMVETLMLNPFWSAYTDAYTRGDVDWMRRMTSKLNTYSLLIVPGLAIVLLISNPFIQWWVDDAVPISFTINISVALYIGILMYASIFTYIINGIGKVKLQLIVYLIFAPVAYPLMTWLCKMWGIPGLLVVPGLVYLCQAVVCRAQVYKILNNKAFGIWNK